MELGEDRLGQTLRAKYRLDRILGAGGMAVVYSATHRNKKRFAVKVLHREVSIDADVRRRFLREGYVANTIDHPGAVAVLDDDVAEDGSAFLVMELLRGASLESIWEESGPRLPADFVLAVLDQVLDVLAAAHDKAIVHRDLKPANLFLTRDGLVKVLDFGIARMREAGEGAGTGTRSGIMLGTPFFMAPEQAGGRTREIGAATDLWALAATAFTLLSGEFVHPAENVSQVLVASATQPARPLTHPLPDAAPALVDFLGRSLAFQAGERWADARAMRSALHEVYRALFGVEVGPDPLRRLALRLPSEPVSEARPSARPTAVLSPLDAPRGVGPATVAPVSMHSPGRGLRLRPILAGAAVLSVVAASTALVVRGRRAEPLHSSWADSAKSGGRNDEPRSAAAEPRGEPAPALVPIASAGDAGPRRDDSRPTPAPLASTTWASPGTAASPPAAAANSAKGRSSARAPSSSGAPPSRGAPPAARAACDPPFVIDSDGHKQYKPECFQ